MKKTIKAAALCLLILTILAGTVLPVFALTPSWATDTYKTSPYYKNLLAVKKTGDMRKDIVAVAKSQVGYHEGNSPSAITGTTSGDGNYTEYGYYFADYYHNDYLKHAAWCGMFVSWCSKIAGIPESILYPSTTAQPTGNYSYKFFGSDALSGAGYKTFYDLRVKGGSYTPLPGDILFYAKNPYKGTRTGIGYEHVAIVESVTYTYNSNGSIASMIITTFEGNTSNKVTNKKWTISTSSDGRVYSGCYIAGFGIPNYSTDVTTPVIDVPDVPSEPDPVIEGYDLGAYGGTVLKNGSTGAEVAKLQMALNVLSAQYTSIPLLTVDGQFGSGTEAAVKQYQSARNLTADGQFGPASWRQLRIDFGAYTKSASDFIVVNGTLRFYKGSSTTPVIPDTVTEVGGGAFFGNKKITSVTFPANLNTVSSYAFYGCSALKTAFFKCGESELSDIINTLGNGPLTSADKRFTQYTITFVDYLGNRYENVCAPGVVPTPVSIPETTVYLNTVYQFIGWDREIVPAAGDAVYTAIAVSYPVAASMISTDEFLASRGDFINVEVKLTVPAGFPTNTTLSLGLDYSAYNDYMDYTGFDPCLPGVQVIETSTGKLKIKATNFSVDPGTTVLARLKFALDDYMPDMDVVPVVNDSDVNLSVYQYDRFFALDTSVSLGAVIVNTLACYDRNKDGVLTIEDTIELLNYLSRKQTSTSVPHSSYYSPTIDDVSTLLNLLSGM